MKGKKTDRQFVSDFISQCLQQGIIGNEDIVRHVQQQIREIDEEIQQVEQRKKFRSKLVDVLTILDNHTKPDHTEDIHRLRRRQDG